MTVQSFHFTQNRNQLSCLKRLLIKVYSALSSLCFTYFIVFLLFLSTLQFIDYSKNLQVKNIGEVIYKINQKPNTNTKIIIDAKTEKNPEQIKKCPSIYGRVTIFVLYNTDAAKKGMYRVANATLHCYLKSKNYELIYIDVTKDERSLKACGKYKTAFWFRKHCVVAEYLKDADWMMVLDADTGIVNPNHCIEEYIDPRVDIIFYERLMHWEIACGNYLVKNTEFARKFLLDWADWEFKLPKSWTGVDNGVLQHHILKTAIPDAKQEYENCMNIWRTTTNYYTYMRFVVCIKQSLGANRVWPGKIRIYRRAHSWVRDGYVTNNDWTDMDFMVHGWKTGNVSSEPEISPSNIKNYTSFFDIQMQRIIKLSPPFTKIPDPEKCDETENGWPWVKEKKKSMKDIKKYYAEYEKYAAKKITYRTTLHLDMPDIGLCYPHCENGTNII